MNAKLKLTFSNEKGINCARCFLARMYQGKISCFGQGNTPSVERYVNDPKANGCKSKECPLVEDNAE